MTTGYEAALQSLVAVFEENAAIQDQQAAEMTAAQPFLAQRHIGAAQAYRAAANETRGLLTGYLEPIS